MSDCAVARCPYTADVAVTFRPGGTTYRYCGFHARRVHFGEMMSARGDARTWENVHDWRPL